MEWIGLIAAATFRSPGKALERDLASGSLQAAVNELARSRGLKPPVLPQVPASILLPYH